MAMASTWEEFFWLLQRLRYRDGVIGVATRNHRPRRRLESGQCVAGERYHARTGRRRRCALHDADRPACVLEKQFKVERDIAVETVNEVPCSQRR